MGSKLYIYYKKTSSKIYYDVKDYWFYKYKNYNYLFIELDCGRISRVCLNKVLLVQLDNCYFLEDLYYGFKK